MTTHHLSLRWSGYRQLETVSVPIEETLPSTGMARVHGFEFYGDVDLDEMLCDLMDEAYGQESFVAIDINGTVRAIGAEVWEYEARCHEQGVYLGAQIPHALLMRRWTTYAAATRRVLSEKFGPAEGDRAYRNLAAFLERVGELEAQGRRPLIHVGGF